MSRPLTSGIYRVRQDVCGPLGLARVERDPREPAHSTTERYTVRFYAREAPTGHLVAVCYRYGVPSGVSEAHGSETLVRVSRADMSAFKAQWPCHGIRSATAWFLFASGGDLIDCGPQSLRDADGGAVVALSNDAYEFGTRGTVPSYLSH